MRKQAGKVRVAAFGKRTIAFRFELKVAKLGFRLGQFGLRAVGLEPDKNLTFFNKIAVTHHDLFDDAAFKMLDLVDRTCWHHLAECNGRFLDLGGGSPGNKRQKAHR